MTPEEREQLNAQVARLDGWEPTGYTWDGADVWRHVETHDRLTLAHLDYLGDPRLWAPILERLLRAGYTPRVNVERNVWYFRHIEKQVGSYDTLAESVLRLFVALKGEV